MFCVHCEFFSSIYIVYRRGEGGGGGGVTVPGGCGLVGLESVGSSGHPLGHAQLLITKNTFRKKKRKHGTISFPKDFKPCRNLL